MNNATTNFGLSKHVRGFNRRTCNASIGNASADKLQRTHNGCPEDGQTCDTPAPSMATGGATDFFSTLKSGGAAGIAFLGQKSDRVIASDHGTNVSGAL